MRTLQSVALGAILPFCILLGWYLYTTYGNVPEGILPSIPSVCDAFADMVRTGRLQDDLAVSLGRVARGFAASAAFGLALGTIMGASQIMRRILSPVVTAIRQIPMIAWTPLCILWFGIGEGSKIAVILLAAAFPIAVNVVGGIDSTPPSLLEVARLYRYGRWRTFAFVQLPHAIPQILTGLRVGLSISWMALIAAELISGTSGIGYHMTAARNLVHSNEVLVCMFAVGVVGAVMDGALAALLVSLTPWERTGRREAPHG